MAVYTITKHWLTAAALAVVTQAAGAQELAIQLKLDCLARLKDPQVISAMKDWANPNSVLRILADPNEKRLQELKSRVGPTSEVIALEKEVKKNRGFIKMAPVVLRLANLTLPELVREAEKGELEAQRLMAYCYSDAKHHTEASHWYKKAAEQGDPESQFNLLLRPFEVSR